jgi:hypothetical protein
VTPERRVRWLLALGAATGLGVATAGIVGGIDAWRPSAGTVAVVNGVPISRDDYVRAVAAVAGDRRTPLAAADEQRILDRLIDEELLLQRGLDLGLVRQDRTLRSQVVAATMTLLARGDGGPPSDEAVRAFYEAHRDYFTSAGRLRVRQVFVRVGGSVGEEAARTRALDAARRLRAGETIDAVRAHDGDDEAVPIPDVLLPPTKLREYVGETAARTALETSPGTTTDPVRSSMGFHVLQVVEQEPPSVPPLDAIRDLVRAEIVRRSDDDALRDSLAALRAAATVRLGETSPR